MTFVLNLLHKDYSLLATDRRGTSAGPVTLTAGSIQIHTTGNTVVEGVKKIRLSDDMLRSVAFAGNTADHGYLDEFAKSGTAQAAMQCVRSHMDSFFKFEDRDRMLRNEPIMENQALVSFFDSEKEAFFTGLYLFSPFSAGHQLYARRLNPSPHLIHVGSGSKNFEKAVGLDEINSFISQLKEGLDLTDQLAWLDMAFGKVSSIDAGGCSDFEAVLSTRADPEFRYVRSNNEVTLRRPSATDH